MSFDNRDKKIYDFILNHKDLVKIESLYTFKTLDFSVDEVVKFAQKNDLMERFVDEIPQAYREGVYLFRHSNFHYEVKVLEHGIWGTTGVSENLLDGVTMKLNRMQKEYLFGFSDTKRKRENA